jgi:xanthine dehydrogenase accessory factor
VDRDTLRQIVQDKASGRSAVLAKNLASGRNVLVYPFEKTEESSLVEAAREAALNDKSGSVTAADGTWFLQVFNPALRMILVGAVHISQPLARMAVMAGYDVIIIDPRRAFATAERFPGLSVTTDWPDEAMVKLRPNRRTAVVALTHDPKIDDPALLEALKSDAFYIGALGSAKIHAKRRDRMLAAGFDDATFQRIKGPVGLRIGARSPAEIAVSVLAEVIQALHASESAVAPSHQPPPASGRVAA